MELSLGNIYTTLRSQRAQTKGRRDREMIITDYLTLPSLVGFSPMALGPQKKRNFARYVSLTKRLITAKVALLPALEKFLNST